MTSISKLIKQFTQQAIELNLISEVDRYYIQNRLLALVKVDELTSESLSDGNLPELLNSLDAIRHYAQTQGLISTMSHEVEQFEA